MNRSGFDFPGLGKRSNVTEQSTMSTAESGSKIGNNKELTPESLEKAAKKVVENLFKQNLKLLKD